jgi:cell division inhibitor SepF
MDLGFAHGLPQVVVFHCRGFDDAQAVALAVRDQQTVLLQVDQLDPVEAQRVVDFVSGAINALDGQSERLREINVLSPTADVLLSRKLRTPA